MIPRNHRMPRATRRRDRLGCSCMPIASTPPAGQRLAGFDISDIGKAFTRMITPSKQQVEGWTALAPTVTSIVGAATGTSALTQVGMAMGGHGQQYAALQAQAQGASAEDIAALLGAPAYAGGGGGGLPFPMPGGDTNWWLYAGGAVAAVLVLAVALKR